jgi:hypothetical protein
MEYYKLYIYLQVVRDLVLRDLGFGGRYVRGVFLETLLCRSRHII